MLRQAETLAFSNLLTFPTFFLNVINKWVRQYG
jgi:hypothetical protein